MKRKSGVNLDAMNYWERAAIGREPDGEEALIYAIKRDLLTPEHTTLLTSLNLSIADCLNGRYTAEQSPAIHAMYRDWNDTSERLGGGRQFSEEDLLPALVESISEQLAPFGVERVEFEGRGGFDITPARRPQHIVDGMKEAAKVMCFMCRAEMPIDDDFVRTQGRRMHERTDLPPRSWTQCAAEPIWQELETL
jgi:hypothetical protein